MANCIREAEILHQCSLCENKRGLLKQCENCNLFWCPCCTIYMNSEIMNMIQIFYCHECEKIGYITEWKHKGIISKADRLAFKKEKRRHYYEVETILNHDISSDERKFLIKWKNYPRTKSTWEPETHLDGAYTSLQNYCIKNSLTLSRIVGKVGSSSDIRSDESRYVDIETILLDINKIKGWHFKNLNIDISIFEGKVRSTGIYLIKLVQHCYVCTVYIDENFGYVADGNNLVFDKGILKELSDIFRMRLIPLQFHQQKFIDHCGSSAIIIATQMMRSYRNKSWPAELVAPKQFINMIQTRLHKQENEEIVSKLNLGRIYCDKCHRKSYSKFERKRMLMHQRTCKGSD